MTAVLCPGLRRISQFLCSSGFFSFAADMLECILEVYYTGDLIYLVDEKQLAASLILFDEPDVLQQYKMILMKLDQSLVSHFAKFIGHGAAVNR